MIERMPDLPDHVLGFVATGEVSAEDYRSVLVPALEQALARTRKVRLLYVLGEAFTGYSGAAAWEDTKVGLEHFTRFERVAVVTDVGWIVHAVKAFGFLVPCEVRVYDNACLDEALRWISEPPATGELSFEFRDAEGVLILRPGGPLDVADFERVAGAIDPYVAQHGRLRGVMIVAEHFPGWDDLAAFAAHVRFVKDHRKKIERLAIVSDDRLLSAMPHIANHFLVRKARHFALQEQDSAEHWILTGQATEH